MATTIQTKHGADTAKSGADTSQVGDTAQSGAASQSDGTGRGHVAGPSATTEQADGTGRGGTSGQASATKQGSNTRPSRTTGQASTTKQGGTTKQSSTTGRGDVTSRNATTKRGSTTSQSGATSRGDRAGQADGTGQGSTTRPSGATGPGAAIEHGSPGGQGSTTGQAGTVKQTGTNEQAGTSEQGSTSGQAGDVEQGSAGGQSKVARQSRADIRQNGDALARHILHEAENAGLRVGQRLPTEREFVDELGVSRTVVRHALARLEALGAISREVGRGTFIRSFAPSEIPAESDDVMDVGPADVMSVRLLLEPQAMPIAVAKATERDLREMDRCLAGGDTAGTYAEFEVWDLALHRCLMVATHNPLLLRLYTSVETARRGQLWGDLKRRSDSAGRREQYQCQHRSVVDALRARDSDAAVTAMRAHLTAVRTNLLGSNA